MLRRRVSAAVLDLDWLPEVDPADVLGCGVRPGLGDAGWVAVGVGLGAWPGAGEGKHRIHKMQFCWC